MSDILVIGGGIAGLSAAARLSADARVTLLEMETATGYHASGRSAALIEENYGAPSVQALNRASMAHFMTGNYLTPRGLLIVAGPTEETAFRADVVHMGVEPVTPSEARDFVPILDPAKVAFAGYHAPAFDIDTDRLMHDFIRTIRKNGGQIITGATVTNIRKDAHGWHVSAGGEYTARTLVNAAGAWADLIAGIAGVTPVGIVPHRRSMARLAAPGGHDTSRWPMFFGVGESWYAKPDAGALLVSPAEEVPTHPHDAYADDMTLAEGLDRYENMVVEPVTRPIATWAGLRSFAPDRTLVLGRDPDVPEFVWCAGQGGYGFQTSPAASALLADLVTGRTPTLGAADVAALRPDRLRV
ncbi:NAD(P)/FAD-dependent oxidoreductase [Sulfitobacter guttiformis]|uniref:Glycine/D-amino acid oxidase-like deaminating enzyme n=1 Tax=Sulfitobacter guttiformis TaxID=74349 RepID=A0A420DTY2_9RHOB|nr:FAD-dependent oxidoreductase [Sulfitobacter guttiformis]KIN71290.1 Oxidoreductase, FAD-binding [Sulfitobacter guttiformis KCTC 32187]RKE97746.1 glycine/D-amino acid oxidase-like deaminating enzyme [Sulfitobacter guttiformis]